MCIDDFERRRIDLVYAEARVEVGEWRHGWTDPCLRERCGGVLDGCVVGVEDRMLVLMRVAPEYIYVPLDHGSLQMEMERTGDDVR